MVKKFKFSFTIKILINFLKLLLMSIEFLKQFVEKHKKLFLFQVRNEVVSTYTVRK